MKNLLTLFCLLFLVLTSWNQIYSQSGSINSTLGSGGSFVIKDASTTFLTLDQANGYLNLSKSLTLLETSGAAVGVIYKGSNRFIHTYIPPGTTGFNTFVGINSGNFAMSLDPDGDPENEQSRNTAVGCNTLKALTYGYDNSAFGNDALSLNTTGTTNSAFGGSALGYNTTGYQNSAFGGSALGSNTTGNVNTALGCNAGATLQSGDNNTFIGNGASPSEQNISNEITLGNSAITMLRCQVTTITGLSDRRDKKNIKYLPLGLDFLMKIKPRLFNWDRRELYEDGISDGSKMDKTPTAGFIAQELDSVQINTGAEWLNLVLKTNPERIEATPGNLFPIVVKAIQDLKFENDALAEENKKLQNELEILRASNDVLAKGNTKLQNELEIFRASIADIVKAEVKAAFLRAVENKESAVEVSLLGSTD